MAETTIDLGVHTVDAMERRPVEDGRGYAWVKIGQESGHVVLRVDTSRLGEYCRKAIRSTRGRSVLAGGAFQFVQIDRCNRGKKAAAADGKKTV